MFKKYTLIICTLFLLVSCNKFNINNIIDIKKLQFKLDSVSDFKVMNISLNNIKSISDFNPLEMLSLSSAISKGNLPLDFTLNLAVKNPNPSATELFNTAITLKSLPFKLFLDDRETIAGNIKEPLTVRGTQTMIIPLQIKLNILEFFNEKNMGSLFNLAKNLSGVSNEPVKAKLTASPVLDTPIGEMKYGKPITIIEKNFN